MKRKAKYEKLQRVGYTAILIGTAAMLINTSATAKPACSTAGPGRNNGFRLLRNEFFQPFDLYNGVQDQPINAGPRTEGVLSARDSFHRQNRSDRDQYLIIYWENIGQEQGL